jgi:hypothetical protein
VNSWLKFGQCLKCTCSGCDSDSHRTCTSTESLWLCVVEALSLYAGRSDAEVEINAEERTELGVTSELDTPVDGCIVVAVCSETSAMLESNNELH